MPQLIKMKLGDQGTILVEVQEEKGLQPVGRTQKIVEATEKAFDKLVQNRIIENCNVLVKAFKQMKEQSILPRKASAEFGLQFNSGGDIYLVKASGQANFKICIEWEFSYEKN